jgi:hypothetical protein
MSPDSDAPPARAPHFYDSEDIAGLLDSPCPSHRSLPPAPAGDCKHCDRWTTTRARRWLQSTKAGVKRGSRWLTTRERLREHFPELWDAIVVRARVDEDDDEDDDG